MESSPLPALWIGWSLCSAARRLQCSQGVQVQKQSRLITVPPSPRQAEKPIASVLSPRPPATFGEQFWPQEAAQAQRARSGGASHGHLSGCPPHTRVPSRGSYHVPLGGWTGSSARSACSPAHPAAPARPRHRGSPDFPGRGIRTEGPQLSSGQFRGRRCAAGCSEVRLR